MERVMREEKEKRRSSLRRRLFWPVVFVLSLLWCTVALAENTVEIRFNGMVDYDRANQVVTLTNQQRQAAGLARQTYGSFLNIQVYV